jgi:hypothetical protein
MWLASMSCKVNAIVKLNLAEDRVSAKMIKSLMNLMLGPYISLHTDKYTIVSPPELYP